MSVGQRLSGLGYHEYVTERPIQGGASLDILCVITAMGCGGAERRLAWLVNRLSDRGHRIALRVLHENGVFFDIDDRIETRFFSDDHHRIFTAPARFWKRSGWLRRQVAAFEPDVVLSFIDVANVVALVSTRGLDVPVVVSERGFPPRSRIPWYYRLLRDRVYRFADAIVVQTDEAASWALKVAHGRTVAVLPNPVTQPQDGGFPAADTALPAGRRIAAMGRLVVEKGFDLLIEAWSSIADRHPGWTVVIFGEGPERDRLERLIADRSLSGRIHLAGQVVDTDALLTRCDLFVMSSRHEGFPNALCEAMACGLAPVSFDCPAGPRNIIRSGIDGVLVPAGDVAALAAQISRLLTDEDLRNDLSGRAVEIVSRFDAETILDSWEDLLRDAAENSGAGAGRCG